MMRMRTSFSRDDGMTLLEVVVAAAILFIIMTAVLGLVGRTMQMGAQAKEINVSNNAVNSYVEWVRSLPFDQVVQSGGSIETTVVVNDEYTITIVPTVEDGENDSLRNLTLDVTVLRSDGFSETFQTSVVVRDRDQHLTDAARSPSTDPTIVYMSPSPPDGTVVWFEAGGSWWKDATNTKRPLQFQVKVKASTGRTLALVMLQGQESWLLQDVADLHASWSEPTWTLSPV
jgi:type II secretory pathway pseudopilin PulG